MCGRYTLITDIVDILTHFGIDLYEDRGHNPQYNVAPTKLMPIINQHKKLNMLKWGCEYKKHYVINVRNEGGFRKLKTWQRCLIPADGYYEWRKEKGIKQPYYFKTNTAWFMFAGLYQLGENAGFTILTSKANEQVKPYHSRMPIILTSDNQFNDFLQNNITPVLYPNLKIIEVNKAVNNVRNNSPTCIEPQTKKQMSLNLFNSLMN
ncbi:SOS response-associated peptidase [Clostridium sp. 'deep sea']|uniref:SOS response-associated peptidase n=1 Tax=Clostridium sp. 'deep sea' TaxID=2779445 RepID=UPI0018968F47|nr:SOS response-associated peptidase [Clostridium sp. 'deep sea']QOR33905.1 SOS response-associated peptidase [Clostridium sp. 'deep sea']